MITNWITFVWNKLPASIRRKLARLPQSRFTFSAAALIANDHNQILLLKHVLRPTYSWGLPGGFLRHSEQPEIGLCRELKEETGLELFDRQFYSIRNTGTHVEIIFTARTKGTPKINSREIVDVGWFRLENLPNDLRPSDYSMIEKVLKS